MKIHTSNLFLIKKFVSANCFKFFLAIFIVPLKNIRLFDTKRLMKVNWFFNECADKGE